MAASVQVQQKVIKSSMKYYHRFKDALEHYGYRVDEHGYVWDSQGNQAAGEDNYGNVQSKDPNVTAICIEEEEKGLLSKLAGTAKKTAKKAAKKVAPKKGMKRARNEKGHYIADDPNTPENEAWVEDQDYGQGKL